MSARGRLRRALSRISVRLLAWNVLLVFLPVAGLLYLDIFEDKLLASQERSMVQQGRLLAAALAGERSLEGERARAILVRLDRRLTARLRVVGPDGELLADTSRLGPRSAAEGEEDLTLADPRESWLYRVGSALFRLLEPVLGDAPAPAGEVEFYRPGQPLLGPEVRAALAGRYGAATRVSPGQRSLTLYSAIPVRSEGRVVGAVLISQSTYRLLQELYEVRLAIFQVFLLSVAAAGVLTLLVATTIVRPLARLRREAQTLVDLRVEPSPHWSGTTRHDEIGDLARALEALSMRLRSRVVFLESLAADVSHAFKNPLAAIRAASEMAATTESPEEAARFHAMVGEDVARLERLLSRLREVTALDAALPEEERTPVALDRLVAGLLEGFRLRFAGRLAFELAAEPGAYPVLAAEERLAQALENVIDNAASFAPEGSAVGLELGREDGRALVRVRDGGPGIPAAHLERVFDRFFSYRPDEADAESRHTGLGLAITRAIVEAHGGSVEAGEGEEGGACITLRLPLAGSSEGR